MAKILDYNFAKMPNEVVLFKDAVTFLFNQGKHQFQVVTVAPTFAGNPGEVTVFRSGTAGRGYLYLGSSWNLAFSFTADAS